MLTISRLDGDTPVSYNGVMPIGRDQLGLGDAASGWGHFYAEIRFPLAWQCAIEHLWTTWPSREPFSPVLGLLRGSLPAWVYISACVKAAIHDYLPIGRWPSVM